LTIRGFVAKENEKRAVESNSIQSPQLIFFGDFFSRKISGQTDLSSRDRAGDQRSGGKLQGRMLESITVLEEYGKVPSIPKSREKWAFQPGSFICFPEEFRRAKLPLRKTGKRGDWEF
jgi:hypothetical protein